MDVRSLVKPKKTDLGFLNKTKTNNNKKPGRFTVYTGGVFIENRRFFSGGPGRRWRGSPASEKGGGGSGSRGAAALVARGEGGVDGEGRR